MSIEEMCRAFIKQLHAEHGVWVERLYVRYDNGCRMGVNEEKLLTKRVPKIENIDISVSTQP